LYFHLSNIDTGKQGMLKVKKNYTFFYICYYFNFNNICNYFYITWTYWPIWNSCKCIYILLALNIGLKNSKF